MKNTICILYMFCLFSCEKKAVKEIMEISFFKVNPDSIIFTKESLKKEEGIIILDRFKTDDTFMINFFLGITKQEVTTAKLHRHPWVGVPIYVKINYAGNDIDNIIKLYYPHDFGYDVVDLKSNDVNAIHNEFFAKNLNTLLRKRYPAIEQDESVIFERALMRERKSNKSRIIENPEKTENLDGSGVFEIDFD